MRILLVDSDAEALSAAQSALQGLTGHEVVTASSAEQAWEREAAGAGVDVLVTEVVMDPADGFSLRDALKGQFPALQTVFVCGYDLSEYAAQIGESPLVAKPFDPAVLKATVERALPPPAAPVAAPRPAAPIPVPRPTMTPAPAAKPAAPKVSVPAASMAGPKIIPAGAPTVTAPRAAGAPPAGAVPKLVPSPAAPAAKPVASPTLSTPRPAVSAAPKPGLPAGTPKPAAAAKPIVKPAVATPGAVPRPIVKPAAAPPHAVPSAFPPVAPAVAPAEEPPVETFGLLGQSIGGYLIKSALGRGRWGPVFAAVQTAINRPVGLKVLEPAKAEDESQRQRFIADARAKANVQHPSILSVYEAGSAEGWYFYTHEFVDGQSLAQMARAGRQLEGGLALKLLRMAAEGLQYYAANNVPHTALGSDDIYLAADNQPRLSNLATQLADQQAPMAVEIDTLGRALLAVLSPGPSVSPGLRALLARCQLGHQAPVADWTALLQGVKALEPKVIPVEAAKISAQDRAAAETVEKARRQQKKAFLMNVAAMVSLVLLVAAALAFVFFRNNDSRFEAQVHIPAGDFISGTGTASHNDEFWIDKYEVTIGQYAKFVDWIDANPGEEHSFDDPRQPKHLSHRPAYWPIYFGQAQAGGAVHSVPTNLGAPANMVTWWDAYAYAHWKGRDLPSELEWERAARGTKGFAYPWGEEAEPGKANTNADFIARDPAARGRVDGFNFWGAVDEQTAGKFSILTRLQRLFSSSAGGSPSLADESPDGVVGMAGNVSEWTGTWTPDKRFPVLKGGNFTLPLQPVSERIANREPASAEEYIGFRTISHKPPGK